MEKSQLFLSSNLGADTGESWNVLGAPLLHWRVGYDILPLSCGKGLEEIELLEGADFGYGLPCISYSNISKFEYYLC